MSTPDTLTVPTRGRSRVRTFPKIFAVLCVSLAFALGNNHCNAETATTDAAPDEALARQQAENDARLAAWVPLALASRNEVLQALALRLARWPGKQTMSNEDAANWTAQLAHSREPRALLVMLGFCQQHTADCASVDIATRWTQVEPDNAYAWLALWMEQDAQKFTIAARKRFVRASQSLYANEFWSELIADVYHGPRPAGAGGDIGQFFDAVGITAALPLPIAASALQHCNDDNEMQAACEHLGRTMIASGKTMMTFGMGIAYAKRGGAPQNFVASHDRKLRELRSEDPQLIQDSSRDAALGSWPYAQDLLAYGELEALRRAAMRAAEFTSGHAHE